jgi:hypothetical protein
MALHSWVSPQEGRRILLSEQVVRGLRMLAIEGFVALPRRGVEVGGILLGEPRGGEVQIEGFEEAPCEHRYGPSYALSASDRAKQGEMLAARNSGMPRVVGFFRSFTSRDPVIEEADEAFVREHFPRGDFVYLMLQPQSAENCVASFRFFRDGQLLPETDDPPFAFDPAEMPVEEPAVEKKPVPSLPPPHRTRLEQKERGLAEVPAWAVEPAPRRSRWWIPALICLVAAISGAALYEIWATTRQPRWTELHLDARPVGGRLEVSWDANAPRALDATRGLLAVTDGETHHDIALDPAQIRAGTYTYMPSHGDVAVRMVLYAKSLGVAGDAVRVEFPNPPGAPQPLLPSEADRTAPALVPAAPPVEAPAKILAAVPPAPLRKVQPRIPAGIRSRISGQVVIPVEVEVSARGRVIRAVAETGEGDSVHRYLAEQAEKAARAWRFAPARTGKGAPVPGSKTIQFVFTQ